MALKNLIFVGFLAVAFGFTIPEEISDSIYSELELANAKEIPHEENLVLTRRARSPDGYLTGTYEHSRRDGSSAGIDYNHRITKNLEAYAGAERNFRYNDNSGHAGIRYRF